MHKQRGLSLVELMISITIGLILMTGVVQLFLSSRATFTTQQAMSRVQETGRLAIDFMARDIRMAGYAGCVSRGETEVVNGLSSDADGDFLYDFDVAMEGHSAGSADSADFLDDLDADVEAGTDVLVVRSGGASVFPLTQASGNSANIKVAGAASGDCAGDICRGDVVVLSDCAQARRFQVTNLTAISGGTEINVVHSNAGGNGNNSISPGNSESTWDQEFGPGSELMRISTIIYYVADNAAGQPSLYQKIGSRSAVELVQGVESLRLFYAVDDGPYQTEGSVTDWNAVSSVRIELLVRSLEDNVIQDVQGYTLAGTTVADPGDRRLRQVFTSTVALRNRLQ